MQFSLTFLVCGAVGWWLDRKFGTAPWLMIGGIAIGAAGAMFSLVRRLAPAAKPHSVDDASRPRDTSKP